MSKPAAIFLATLSLLCLGLLYTTPYWFSAVALFCLVPLFIIINRISFPHLSTDSVGFFHPHAEDGGGGERVLWCAIDALATTQPHLRYILYTHSGFQAHELIARAERNFGIRVTCPLEIVPLSRVPWLNSDKFRRFTLVCQSLASVWVAWEGLGKRVPEVFVDTSGWAFCYPLARMAGSKVACYVHYPTISSDMVHRVKTRRSLYNNSASIAKSNMLSWFKLCYYQAFAAVYGLAGKCASATMVNSTWTWNHIEDIWGIDAKIVYPPVDTTKLQQLPLERPETKAVSLISIAQFRPEKNHALQLRAFKKALVDAEVQGSTSPLLSAHFKIVGSCRNASDQGRLCALKDMVASLELEDRVQFFENIPVKELHLLLGDSTAGLHTMTDEHFGIGIVEYMAAGVIPIAHNSGGPKLDILAPPASSPAHTPPLGFLCTTVDEYATAITQVIQLDAQERLNIASECRHKAQMFSQEKFQEAFCDAMQPLLGKR